MDEFMCYSYDTKIELLGNFDIPSIGNYGGRMVYEPNNLSYIEVLVDKGLADNFFGFTKVHINGAESATRVDNTLPHISTVKGELFDSMDKIWYVELLSCHYAPSTANIRNGILRVYFTEILIDSSTIPEEILSSSNITASIYYNTWDEFCCNKASVSIKDFTPIEESFNIDNKRISFCQTVRGDILYSRNVFGQLFAPMQNSMDQDEIDGISLKLNNILAEHATKLLVKNSKTHRSYISVENLTSISDVIDFSENFNKLISLLTKQSFSSIDKILLKFEGVSDRKICFIYRTDVYNRDIEYHNHMGAFKKSTFNEEEWCCIVHNLFSKDVDLDLLFFTLAQNYNDSHNNKFTPFVFTRTMDCVSNIGSEINKKEGLKGKHYERVLANYLQVINDSGVADKLKLKLYSAVKRFLAENEEDVCSLKNIGQCMSHMRGCLVHKDDKINKFRTIDAMEVYSFIELMVMDYMLEVLGVDLSKRSKFAVHYLGKILLP